MKQTITKVFKEPREFSMQDGVKLHGIKFLFENEDYGEINCKPENSAKIIEALQELKGKEVEFELKKPEPREYQGEKYWQIKTFPGNPVAGSGGGGRTFQVAFANTKEGQYVEQERMDRRTALMQSVSVAVASGDYKGIVGCATAFYNWLRSTSDSRPAPEPAVTQPTTNGEHADSDPFNEDEDDVPDYTAEESGKLKPGTKFEGPEDKCPTCHAPKGKQHGRQCIL